MNEIADFIPLAASALGLAPTTLLFGIFVVNQGAKVIGRLIPNNKKGPLGVVRKVANVLGADPSSRITGNITVQDAAKATIEGSLANALKKG